MDFEKHREHGRGRASPLSLPGSLPVNGSATPRDPPGRRAARLPERRELPLKASPLTRVARPSAENSAGKNWLPGGLAHESPRYTRGNKRGAAEFAGKNTMYSPEIFNGRERGMLRG